MSARHGELPPRELGVHRELDGLRGLAILAVLATHVIFLDGGSNRWALRGGFLGVDVFLVLSGFLICAVLVREAASTGAIDRVDFARRRARRLVPPLLLMLVVQAPVAVAIGSTAREQALQAVLALGNVANWQLSFGHRAPFELVHLWSLSLEVQFYALLAFGVWAGRTRIARLDRRAAARLVLALFAAAAVVGVWRLALTERGLLLESLYQRTDTRADALLLGVAGYLAWRHRLVSDTVIRSLGCVGAVTLAVAWWVAEPSSLWLFRGGFTVLAVATAAVVAAAAVGGGIVARVADAPPLRWVGSVSYSLYLWHLPIYIWVRRALAESPLWVVVVVAVPLSFLAAVLSHRVAERRAIARRRVVATT